MKRQFIASIIKINFIINMLLLLKLATNNAGRQMSPICLRVTVRNNSTRVPGFGFVYKARPAGHIEIRVGGCNAVDGPKDKQDVELFLTGVLNAVTQKKCRAG
jgi:hypothetical protein